MLRKLSLLYRTLERINATTFAPTKDAAYIRTIHLPRNVRYRLKVHFGDLVPRIRQIRSMKI